MFACGSHYFFSSVLIISQLFIVINLVLCLFTHYTFFLLLPSGKRAPTVNGRGSSPRSRTGCDIFGFGNHLIATMPDNNSILCSRAGYIRLLLPLLQVLSSFNLLRSTRPPCFYWTTTYPPPLVTSTLYILLQLESTCLRSYRIPERPWQPFPRSRCTLKYVELALADYHASRAKVQYLCYP